MKIGLIDCIYNKIDGRAVANRIMESKIVNLEVIGFSAPEILKVPVSAKKMFSDGADAVLVFLTVSDEEREAFNLVQEKVIDVEINFGKLVFYCVVFDAEWRREEQLKELAEKKLADAIDLISKIVHAPELARETAAAPPSITDAFGLTTQQSEEEDIHSLF